MIYIDLPKTSQTLGAMATDMRQWNLLKPRTLITTWINFF